MVLVLIGIAVGILIVVILIIKASKTPRDILGMDLHCVTCGAKTSGSQCPKCKKNNKTFGV